MQHTLLLIETWKTKQKQCWNYATRSFIRSYKPLRRIQRGLQLIPPINLLIILNKKTNNKDRIKRLELILVRTWFIKKCHTTGFLILDSDLLAANHIKIINTHTHAHSLLLTYVLPECSLLAGKQLSWDKPKNPVSLKETLRVLSISRGTFSEKETHCCRVLHGTFRSPSRGTNQSVSPLQSPL